MIYILILILLLLLYFYKDYLLYINDLNYSQELETSIRKLINDKKLCVLTKNNKVFWKFQNGKININKSLNIDKNLFIYHKIPIFITLNKNYLNQPDIRVTCKTLICFKKQLDNFCDELITKTIKLPTTQKTINIYTISNITQNNIQWKTLCTKPGRPLETIFMDEKIKHCLVTDMHDFLSSRHWYVQHNVPYRRGYLLHGSTGCGKSSLLVALCSELNLNIYWISLKKPGYNDIDLSRIFNSVPKGQLILVDGISSLESSSKKIDTFAHTNIRKIKRRLNPYITISGLLSALDGPIAHTGHIVFFTTTSHKYLHPELIRPGRIDYVVELPNANRISIKEMFMHFYSDYINDTSYDLEVLAEKFANSVENDSVPLCVIQNHLIQYKHDPLLASSKIPNDMDL